MELRRALLLFAIVLGVAAVVAALSAPNPPEPRTPAPSSPASEPDRRASAKERTVVFDASEAPARRTLDAGVAATVEVRVDEPQSIELEGLGLLADAAPVAPARFSVLADQPGRYEVRAVQESGVPGRTLGLLIIRPAG